MENHALNYRVNCEFKNKFPTISNDLIIADNGKYLLHIDYLYVGKKDISKTACKIIEKYIDLLVAKDYSLINILQYMQNITNYSEKSSR